VGSVIGQHGLYSVTESRSLKGWAVTTAQGGISVSFAVFRHEEHSLKYADDERFRLGLMRLHLGL
jgi:hypothetical protein